jgi:hypothetical protein
MGILAWLLATGYWLLATGYSKEHDKEFSSVPKQKAGHCPAFLNLARSL